MTVAKEAIILQQSGSARSADGRRKPPFIHRHLVPGVYGTPAAASQVTSSISVCARLINAKMWTKVNLAFFINSNGGTDSQFVKQMENDRSCLAFLARY